jgi:hypothetical protein
MNVATINRITYKRQAGIGSCCGRTIFYTACMIAELHKIATRYGSADPDRTELASGLFE